MWQVPKAMLTVPMDVEKVARCRQLAGAVADDVQRYIDAHTSVGVERTILRAYGIDGVDDQGAPLVNLVVDRYAKAGLLSGKEDKAGDFVVSGQARGAAGVQLVVDGDLSRATPVTPGPDGRCI
jgi:hypothetical protein